VSGRCSPTEALCLLMGGGLSAHDAADRLNTGMRTKKCRLWCDGNELPVAYIVTSLQWWREPKRTVAGAPMS
jgi:hypothetical protein